MESGECLAFSVAGDVVFVVALKGTRHRPPCAALRASLDKSGQTISVLPHSVTTGVDFL